MSNMFGKKFAENFAQDPTLLNLNSGASGIVCKPALEAKMKSLEERVAFPDKYYWDLRRGLNLRTTEREGIAKVLDADMNNVVFCQGATTAFNAIVRSFPWNHGDKVIVMSTFFVNCRNTLQWVASKYNLELVVLPIQYPISDKDLVQQFADLVDEVKPRLACFDVVSSTPSVYFPWEDMCKVCNDRDIVSLVDGAHGIGLVPVSLRKAQPSFWFSNIHKWYWVTQSGAVLYVDPKYQKDIQSLPIAEVDPKSTVPDRFIRSFCYSSTLDYTVIDSLPAATKFRESLGEDAIFRYQTDLGQAACKMLCDRWGVQEVNPLARRQAMFTILCPQQPENKKEFCNFVANRLLNNHRLVIPTFVYEDKVWVRFCGAVYLELEDFTTGAEALEECFDEYFKTNK